MKKNKTTHLGRLLVCTSLRHRILADDLRVCVFPSRAGATKTASSSLLTTTGHAVSAVVRHTYGIKNPTDTPVTRVLLLSDDRGSLELRKTTDYGRTFQTIATRVYSFVLGGRFVFASIMTGTVRE